MARVNKVELYGIVTEPPKVIKDDRSGAYKQAVAVIRVIRTQERDAKDGRRYPVYSQPVILTKDDLTARMIETWKQNDLVHVAGMLATTPYPKMLYCPNCHQPYIKRDAQLSFIYPVFAKRIKHMDTKEEAVEELQSWRKVSNRIYAVGNLARDPKRVRIKKKNGKIILVCQYPLAINRHVFIPTDPQDRCADFPWVKTYGEFCDQDYFRLQKGSQVSIDGHIQTRSVLMHPKCDACGTRFDYQENTLEIVPYATEYLKDYRTQDEADELMAARREESYKNTLAKLAQALGTDSSETSDDMNGIGEVTDENELFPEEYA